MIKFGCRLPTSFDRELFSFRSVEYVEQSLNDEGQTISRWYGDNFLKGNYDKYNAMLINRGNNSDQFINVNIDGYTIKSTPNLKLLGVTLDDKLKFSKHVSDICKQASKKVGVLVRLRKMILAYRSQALTIQSGNSTR